MTSDSETPSPGNSNLSEELVPNESTIPFLSRLGGFMAVGIQLILVLSVVRQFDIADRNHFFVVCGIAAAGFAIHFWLPVRIRTAFFCLLSLGTVLFVLGWPNGAWLLGIGSGLIGLCHLPLAFPLRIALVALAGMGLAIVRLDYPAPFWPVLGSMFMFRIIAYLYDLRLDPLRRPSWLTGIYFFPLPNVCFLFFPILDPKTMRESYDRAVHWTVAQDGVGWIVHGIVHLLLYRYIKYFIIPLPDELVRVSDVALFLAANYALYLRVSGHFHIIIGLFHLFGFRLPRTHHHYFLASSFTDIWRRINIYWKDFMMKVFFLPAFFALRGWGTRPAAVAATFWVFLMTWLLHAYQVFWLTGTLPLAPYDALLWLILGTLVAWNVQRDLARNMRGRGVDHSPTVIDALGHSLQVVGMFVLVSVFWTFWNTPSVVKLLPMVRWKTNQALMDFAGIAAVLLAACVAGVCFQMIRTLLIRSGTRLLPLSPAWTGLGYATALLILLLAAVPQVTGILGAETQHVISALRRESLTASEAGRAAQGYYEEMTETRATAGDWLAALEGRPRVPDAVLFLNMSRPADAILERELIPGWSGEIAGNRLTVNSLGLRDRPELTLAKPPGTVRFAFVGTSVVMGYGVADEEPFPRVVEKGINERGLTGRSCQVVNFGTGKSYPLQRSVLIDQTVFGYRPDAIFYVAHQDELREPVRNLALLVSRNVDLPYPFLKEIVRQSRLDPTDPLPMIEVTLRAFATEIVRGIYRHIVAECRTRNVLPVWVYLPIPGVVDDQVQSAGFAALAREAGFEVVDLSDWADGHRPSEIKVGESGPHPNALGHRLIADRLLAELMKRPELIPGQR